MTKINLEKNIYLYGNNYVAEAESPDNIREDIIIYNSITNQTKQIGSLEGFFISEATLLKNYVCNRHRMKDFEFSHNGEFVPFGK